MYSHVIDRSFQATGQIFGVASTYSSQLQAAQFPPDGILGMAYQSISAYGATPLFQNLLSQGQFSTPVFSFYIDASGYDSAVYFGGTNQSLYTGSFTYMPVTNQVRMDGRVSVQF